MRRFFACLMCVSGFSLAVTCTHAEEPLPVPSDAAARPDDQSPEATDPAAETRTVLHELLARWRELYRREFGDDELRAEMKASMKQLEQLFDESRRVANSYTGQALKQARATLDKRIAQLEESLDEAEERSIRQAAAADESRLERLPEEANEGRGRGAPMPLRPQSSIESRLSSLRELAEQLEQTAGEEAEKARAAIQQQIDQLERYLAERRARRDAASIQPPLAEMMDTERRLAALKLAIRSLRQARFDRQADELEPELANLEAQAQASREQREQARELARRELPPSRPRPHIEQRHEPGAISEVRELAADVRELRREVRRLRSEVEALRKQHATSADGEASEQKSPDRETE